jgi:hypothetical protein
MAAYRQFDGEIKVLEQINPWTFRVELWLLNGKVNRNGWRYERLREHLRSFLDTPILIAYPTRNQIGDGHNFRMTPDPKTGEMVPTFTDADAEHIVGRLSEKESDIRIEERDGTEWVVGTGIIWKWYARELVDKIAKDAEQGRAMSVSIETLVTESRMEGEVEVETSWEVLGTTILGDHVAPAVADARIKALRALREPFAELKIRAASWENKKTNDKPNHNDEKGVKNLAIKSMSKAQIKAAESKLPGYTVLSANELDNGTVKIVAAAKNGELFVCSAESVNDVTTEALTAHNMAVDVDGVEIDLGGALERMLSAVDVLTAQVEKLNADLADERKKNEDMANAEQKRRKNAAKTAAKNELAKINACRVDGEKINESCISEVLEAAENGEFSDCTDCNGEWCGEEKACAAVRDKAMQEQMKLDAARMNGKGKTVYAFEQGAKGGKAPASEIEQLYNEMTGNG